MISTDELYEKYLRKDMIPTMFCPGCGNGAVLNYTLRAIDSLKIDQDKLVFISGIGCSSRLPGYIKADALHTTHGRAIAFATGIKATNPDLTVIVFTGDGDLGSIGLSHFLHGIRRNIDITVICINNFNYGMTGGQASSSMPMGDLSTTTPYQNIEHSFNLSLLAKAAGAVYVARWTFAHSIQAITAIKRAISKKGFTFVEILSSCPVSYGRSNISKDPRAILRFFLENSIRYHASDPIHQESAKTYPESQEQPSDLFEVVQSQRGKLLIGEFCDLYKPDYHELFENMKIRAKKQFWAARNEKND
jgi:2-oxoglutarate ferredoxin oxidoreductase subunit beta